MIKKFCRFPTLRLMLGYQRFLLQSSANILVQPNHGIEEESFHLLQLGLDHRFGHRSGSNALKLRRNNGEQSFKWLSFKCYVVYFLKLNHLKPKTCIPYRTSRADCICSLAETMTKAIISLRYRSSEYYNTPSSLWPYEIYYLKIYSSNSLEV